MDEDVPRDVPKTEKKDGDISMPPPFLFHALAFQSLASGLQEAVDLVHQHLRVNAVHHRRLLNGLHLRRGTSETVHSDI